MQPIIIANEAVFNPSDRHSRGGYDWMGQMGNGAFGEIVAFQQLSNVLLETFAPSPELDAADTPKLLITDFEASLYEAIKDSRFIKRSEAFTFLDSLDGEIVADMQAIVIPRTNADLTFLVNTYANFLPTEPAAAGPTIIERVSNMTTAIFNRAPTPSQPAKKSERAIGAMIKTAEIYIRALNEDKIELSPESFNGIVETIEQTASNAQAKQYASYSAIEVLKSKGEELKELAAARTPAMTI